MRFYLVLTGRPFSRPATWKAMLNCQQLHSLFIPVFSTKMLLPNQQLNS
jgi:hypothetical protein